MTPLRPISRCIFMLLSIVLLPWLQSCTGGDADLSIDYVAVQIEGSDKWSLMAPDGAIIAENQFDERPTIAVGGCFSAMLPDGISVYRIESTPTLLPGCSGLEAAGLLTDGVIPIVRHNSRIALVDADGSEVCRLDPVDDHEIEAVAPYFTCGRMVFRIADPANPDGLFGALTSSGHVAVEPRFCRLFPYRNDIALAATTAEKSSSPLTYHLIDPDGATLFTFPDEMTPLSEGLYSEIMPVNFDGSVGFINAKGSYRPAPDSVKSIVDFTDHTFVYSTAANRLGAMTMEGRELLPPEYIYIAILDNDHFLATTADGSSMILNRSGDVLATLPDTKSVATFRNMFPLSSTFNIIGKTTDNTFIIYDADGRPITDTPLTHISAPIMLRQQQTVSGPMLRSDFVDLDRAIANLIDPLSSIGFGIAQIGRPLSSTIEGDPEKFTAAYSSTFLNRSGYRFSIEATAYSSSPAAVSQPIYEDHSFLGFFNYPELTGYEYVFNPDATINRITATLSTDNKSYSDTRPTIEARLRSKGYQPIESTDAYIVMHNSQDINLIIVPKAQCRGTVIYLLSDDALSTYRSTIIREAEINFNL